MGHIEFFMMLVLVVFLFGCILSLLMDKWELQRRIEHLKRELKTSQYVNISLQKKFEHHE